MRKNIETEKELTQWKSVAIELNNALSRMYFSCYELDHHPDEYHKHNEECPVVEKIQSALDKFKQLEIQCKK